MASLYRKANAALSKSIRRIHLSIRTGYPHSTAVICFGSSHNYVGASAGHGWQQIGSTCPATDTGASSTSRAATRHPREAETKRRAEGTPPAWHFYSYKGYGANQRTKGTTQNVCIKN